MDAETVTIIAAVIASIGGATGVGTLARARAQNRVDLGTAEKAKAETEAVLVETARGLVADVRLEMDRKVTDLDREVGRLRGHLESAVAERDHLREVEKTLRRDNAMLRSRLERLENRVRELTDALAAAASGAAPADVALAGAHAATAAAHAAEAVATAANAQDTGSMPVVTPGA